MLDNRQSKQNAKHVSWVLQEWSLMIKKIFEKSCPFIGKSLNFSIFLRIQLHFFEDSFHEMKDLISNVYNFLFVCRPKPFNWLLKKFQPGYFAVYTFNCWFLIWKDWRFVGFDLHFIDVIQSRFCQIFELKLTIV